MKAGDKTKEQLIEELNQKIAELEKSETLRKRAEEILQRQTGDLQELSDKDVQNLVHELERTRLNWKCRTKNFAGHKMNLKSRAVSILTCMTLPRLVILLWFKVTSLPPGD